MRTTFQMVEFHPQQSWKWIGTFLGATIHYDHVFEPVAPGETRIRFTVGSTGGLTPLLGGIFGWIYRRNLERAIPRLTAEIEGLSGAAPAGVVEGLGSASGMARSPPPLRFRRSRSRWACRGGAWPPSSLDGPVELVVQ